MGASESNMEFSGGFDYLISPFSRFYVGVRAGVYQEQVLTSVPVATTPHVRPFLGGQAFLLFPLERFLGLKLGGAADLLLAAPGSSLPVWLYTGVLAGLRVKIWDPFYIEIPGEIGLTPFFDGSPVFLKIGFQTGIAF